MDATTILANMLREGRATVNEVRAINEAYRDGVLTERRRCADVARHLNGWGADRGRGGHAEHIAKIIEGGPFQ